MPQITCCPSPDVGVLPIAGILGCAHTSCLFSLLLCFGADVFIPRLWPELAQGPAAVWADLTLCAPESGAGASQKGQGGRRGRAGSGLLCPGTSPMIEVFFRPLQKCSLGDASVPDCCSCNICWHAVHLKNHRMVRSEGTSNLPRFIPCHEQDCPLPDQAARGPTNLALGTSRDGTSTCISFHTAH